MTKPAWLQQAELEYDRGLLLGRANGTIFVRENKTEAYVCIPPAYVITDSDGATWTFGDNYNANNEINVLRDDKDIDQYAERIEYQRGVVTLYGKDGTRKFSRNRKHFV